MRPSKLTPSRFAFPAQLDMQKPRFNDDLDPFAARPCPPRDDRKALPSPQYCQPLPAGNSRTPVSLAPEFCSLTLLIGVLFSLSAGCRRAEGQEPGSDFSPPKGTVRAEAIDGERLRVGSELVVRLIGVDAPNAPWGHDLAQIEAAQRQLGELVQGQDLKLTFSDNHQNAAGEVLAWVETNSGKLINEHMLASGWARYFDQNCAAKYRDRLQTASREARQEKRGLFAAWQPRQEVPGLIRPFQGFSLALYSRDENFDYLPFLQEQKALGARDVMIVSPWFMPRWDSTTIRPEPYRSTSLAAIQRVIRQAQGLDLVVTLMPIVLLLEKDKLHWRGNIEPSDLEDWFDSYAEFISATAALAEAEDIFMLVLGSEFSSLEQHDDAWRKIIRAVRERYQGLLSYSANWDHVQVLKFWDELDAVGMTGYHSLTKKDDPTVSELVLEWRRIKKQLEALMQPIGLPYFFSELGYASLDGINKNPWDYVSPEAIDAQEQADCYEAYFKAWEEADVLFRGAFFYTWWRDDNERDARQYTVKGKPAEELIRKRFQGNAPSRDD